MIPVSKRLLYTLTEKTHGQNSPTVVRGQDDQKSDQEGAAIQMKIKLVVDLFDERDNDRHVKDRTLQDSCFATVVNTAFK